MFGVDTASLLTQINWSAFHNWKGAYPSFAGRYFGSGYVWNSGEGSSAKQATGGALDLILPIQASIQSRQQTTGTAGYNDGSADANDTCERIVTAINSGELSLLASREVKVYLDVEAGTNLSVDYWAGWATTVWNYALGQSYPFFPSIYCHYFLDVNGKYSPDTVIQNTLNAVCSSYPLPTYHAICYSFWTNEPEPCSNCVPNPFLDWTQFNSYSQPCGGSSYPVNLELWQYAEQGGCVNTCGASNFAGGQNLDMDDTNSTIAPNYMLFIN